MINARDNFRLRKHIDLYIKIDNHQLADPSKILNISLSGLSFSVAKDLKLTRGTVVMLDAPDIPALPKEAKLKWCRPISNGMGFLCGCSFIKVNSNYSNDWKQWMEVNMMTLAEATDNKILGKYLDFQEE